MPDQDCEVRAGGDVIFRVDDGAAILQLNRPAKRNALSQAMWEAICADLTELRSGDREAAARYRKVSLRGYNAVRDFSLPTVAAIDGLCIGGGNNLALACDIRLASPRASFAIPAVRHGIVYDRPTVTRLVELMGSGRAGFLDALRAADMPTLLAIRDTIRQVR